MNFNNNKIIINMNNLKKQFNLLKSFRKIINIIKKKRKIMVFNTVNNYNNF